MRKVFAAALISGLLLALARPMQAQTFPTGPVKIISSVGAGGGPDVLTRILADHLTQIWGQQVVVLNQPGGAGAVAIRALASSPADGHTLYMSLASNYIALPELRANFPEELVRDLVPVGFVGAHPMVIAARSDLGVKSLPEFIALAKQRKGELNVASGNRGSILHLTGEWLRNAAGIDVVLVHYASASTAIADVMGGRMHAMIDSMTAMRSAIDAGTLKPLAIATKDRQPSYPDLATFAATIPGFESMGWLALVAPPGTPVPVAQKISEALRTALARPELRKRFHDLGTEINPTTPDELRAFIRDQIDLWRPVIARTAKTSG
jgi:tripartite-type tricarboxylate transporter receptor subunit TctC